ncbi:MAG: hypothetical protein MJZ45_02865 [Bacteroidales bacterium]|nr:hypothetical protein [Bacteroidales bacterium]
MSKCSRLFQVLPCRLVCMLCRASVMPAALLPIPSPLGPLPQAELRRSYSGVTADER